MGPHGTRTENPAETSTRYITTSIPYVNAAPHVGHALELLQADALARHSRRRGDAVRFQSGTDDHAQKNVAAASLAGLSVEDHVERNARAFRSLTTLLDVSVDDFVSTSTDPRHRSGVEELWRRCSETGDFYLTDYTGRYCQGCEQFFADGELVDDRCPDHDAPLEIVSERNWFFRLSRYSSAIADALRSGRIRIEPEQRRNAVLATLDAGLDDISVSRDARRSEGWGIPVPGDRSQVIYVWWDALANYVTGLGVDDRDGQLARWWSGSDERIHVVGKGIAGFHAIIWPALLLSAGLALPTRILIHDYVTVEGRKISKSLGNVVSPFDIVERFGADPFRWWCLADVARLGDTDFRVDRLVRRWNQTFPGGIGNLSRRVTTLLVRNNGPRRPTDADQAEPRTVSGEVHRLDVLTNELAGRTDDAFERFDLRTAALVIDEHIAATNRLLERTEPWKLVDAPGRESLDEFDAVIGCALRSITAIAAELSDFTPASARLVADALASPTVAPLFTRLDAPPRPADAPPRPADTVR